MCPLAAAAAPDVHTSLQGYSGLLTVPHGETLPAGRLSANVTDFSPAPGLDDVTAGGFTFGLYRGFELGGRVVEVDDAGADIRDLSGNAKLQVLRIDGWPTLAVGASDIAGNQRFSEYYAASSWSWGPLRFSAGYGWKGERLDGAFGGVEWGPADWIHLVAEASPEVERAGLRLSVPLPWQASLTAIGAYDLSGGPDAESFGIALALPLGGRDAAPKVTAALPPPAVTPALTDAPTEIFELCGGERLRSTPIDSLGVLLGQAIEKAPVGTQTIRATLVREGRAQLQAELPATAAAAWLADGSAAPVVTFPAKTECAEGREKRPVEVLLEPNLISFVGTEFGVLDADVALRARLQVPLFSSAGFNVSLLTPAVRSDDFDDGGNFEDFRSTAGVDQALFQLYSHPGSQWHSLVSIGYLRVFDRDTAAILTEQVIQSASGRHAFRLHAGVLGDSEDAFTLAVGEWRMQMPALESSLGLAFGKYAAGDSGARLEWTRFFDDTAVSLFVKSAGSADNESAGGLGFSFPLRARFDRAEGGWDINGSERWGHSVQTTFGDQNKLKPNLLVEPLPDRNLRDSYLDYYRATPAWAEAFRERMREGALSEWDAP